MSMGDGIELEVLSFIFSEFLGSSAEWFLPRADDQSSLAITLSLSAARFLPAARRRDLMALGAVTALLLIHQIAPIPLGPAFLQYVIHDCDLNSLHPAFLSEWHPELYHTIKNWIASGPEGNAVPFRAPFATWSDLDVSRILATLCILTNHLMFLYSKIATIRQQTQESHYALAAELLRNSLIGCHPPQHPEFEAFLRGFALPCRNGFTFLRVRWILNGNCSMR